MCKLIHLKVINYVNFMLFLSNLQMKNANCLFSCESVKFGENRLLFFFYSLVEPNCIVHYYHWMDIVARS